MAARKPKGDYKDLDLEYLGSKDEAAETRTLASRARLRSQMDDDIEKFLSKGGKISEIEPNVTADPPTKPVNSYGSRPI